MAYIAFILALLAGPTTKPAPNQQPHFVKVDISTVVKGRNIKVFPIQDAEAAIAGNHVKRVEVGKDSAVITYLNKTKQGHKPRYKFRVYDAYGIRLASFEDYWAFSSIDPDKLHKEDKRFNPMALDEAFEYTGITLPDDWATPVYLVVEGEDL